MNTAIWIFSTVVISSAWGPSYQQSVEFIGQSACYNAINKSKISDNGKYAQGERGQVVVMRCYPKPEPK